MIQRIAQAGALLAIGVALVTLALAQGARRDETPGAKPRAAAPPAANPHMGAPTAPQPGAAPAPPTEADLRRRAQTVARFTGGAVTLGDIEDSIARQSPYMRRRYLDPEVKKDLLEKTVRFELLANEAERRGYAGKDAVEQTAKQNAVQGLMKEELDDKITPEQVPADDVKKYYEANLAEFVRPAVRRVGHVMFATLEEARAALAEARAMDMRQFRELARTKSIDEQSNARGGDLGYFDAQGKARDEGAAESPPSIVKAAFALQNVGDVAPDPVKIEGGYSLVKLTGQRPANERTLADADATIRTRLWRERRQAATEAFVEKLRAELKPVIHGELLGQIDLAKEAEPTTESASP